MARLRRTSKRRAEALLVDVAFPLLIGPSIRHRFLDFDDPRSEWERRAVIEELRAPWFKFRAEIMEMAPAGQRPWGFWEYEQAGHHPEGAADSAKRLAAMGELTEAEGAAVKSWEALSHPPSRPRSDLQEIPAQRARSPQIARETEGNGRIMADPAIDDWLPMTDGRELPPVATWTEDDGQQCARWTMKGGRGLERRRKPDGSTTWWLTNGPDDPPRIVAVGAVCERIPPDDLQGMS